MDGADPLQRHGVHHRRCRGLPAGPGVEPAFDTPRTRVITAIGKSAWLALMNQKAPTAGPWSSARTKLSRERGCRAPASTTGSRTTTGRVRRARWPSGGDCRRRLGRAAALDAVSLREPVLDGLVGQAVAPAAAGLQGVNDAGDDLPVIVALGAGLVDRHERLYYRPRPASSIISPGGPRRLPPADRRLGDDQSPALGTGARRSGDGHHAMQTVRHDPPL